MISDLSPGDKLSLKGKIFELQKKLQIIDFETKRDGEFSFKPTILNYNLPERKVDVLENIQKAEMIRKVITLYCFETDVLEHNDNVVAVPHFNSNCSKRKSCFVLQFKFKTMKRALFHLQFQKRQRPNSANRMFL